MYGVKIQADLALVKRIGYAGRMALEPFKLERYYARYEFTTRYMLSSSDCEARTVDELLALEPEAEARLRACWLGYTEAPGAPELRTAIAAIYNGLDPHRVLVHVGAEEAIYTFFHALLAPGDHVIVQTPCYQSAMSVPRALGCSVSEWAGDPARGWAPDPAALAGLFRPNTRALYLCSPSNPTGHHFDAATFREVVAMADARGVTIFSDEVYRELEHDPRLRLPAACELSPRAVSLGVMSKAYGLPGLRIGWAASHDAALLAGMATVKDYLSICASAPAEVLACVALRHRQTLVARNLAIVQVNLRRLDAFFASHNVLFSWARPVAGPIGFVRYHGAEPTATFCARVAEGCGVLLAPGELYDRPGHFRLGFGRANLPEAVDVLEGWLGR